MNSEKKKTKSREDSRKWRAANREKSRENARRQRLAPARRKRERDMSNNNRRDDMEPKDQTSTTPEQGIRGEFTVHKLNEVGMRRAEDLAKLFSQFLNNLEAHTGVDGRDVALMRTQLQLASFHAKRAIATQPENQA